MSKAKAKPTSAASPSSDPDSSLPVDPLSSLSPSHLASHLASLHSRLSSLRASRALAQQSSSLVLQQHSALEQSNALSQSHLTNVASAVERLSESSRAEVRVYQQKTVHLTFAHDAALSTLRTAHVQSVADSTQHNHSALHALNDHMATHQSAALHSGEEDEEEFRRLRETNKKELVKLKENFDKTLDTLTSHYHAKTEQLTASMDLRCKLELHEVEERKNKHLNELMANFDKSFADIKAYYQQVTADNITLIRELQSEIVEIKKSQEKKEKSIVALTEKNAEMNVPLAESNKTKKMLQAALVNYDKNRTTLSMLQRTVKAKQTELQKGRERLAQLERQLSTVHDERMSLQTSYQSTLDSAEQKHQLSTAPLHASLHANQDLFEHKRGQFQAVLRASALSPQLVAALTEKLDGLLGEKGRVISGLLYEVEKCKKGYDDMRRVMEAKMEGWGVSRRPRGKRERRMEFVNEGRGTQPADLILR